MSNIEGAMSLLPENVREMIAIEQRAASEYRNKSMQTSDPKLRNLFTRLAEMHASCLSELESHAHEVESQNEITLQINAMFGQ